MFTFYKLNPVNDLKKAGYNVYNLSYVYEVS